VPLAGNTQVVAKDWEGPVYCSLCDTALAIPVTSHNKIQRANKRKRRGKELRPQAGSAPRFENDVR
jgi:hypothetical protein